MAYTKKQTNKKTTLKNPTAPNNYYVSKLLILSIQSQIEGTIMDQNTLRL